MSYSIEPIFEMYIYEIKQLLVDLEIEILEGKFYGSFSIESLNKIYNIFVTINGKACMFLYNDVCSITSWTKELFNQLKSKNDVGYEFRLISKLLYEIIEYMKLHLSDVGNNKGVIGNHNILIKNIYTMIAQILRIP